MTAPPAVPGPGVRALTVIGIGTVLAALVGLVYGFAIGDIPRGLGQAGLVTMIIVAVLAVLAVVSTWPWDTRARSTQQGPTQRDLGS